MEQTKALNALAPFVALAPSATSPRAAAKLIVQAISTPQAFVFAELLETDNIQALRQTEVEWARWLRLLEIFAWGTWQDYNSARSSLPELNEQQEEKLRQLSLVSLCSGSRHRPNECQVTELSYSALQRELASPTLASLESLVTSAIYSGLVTGTLNPALGVVALRAVAPLRDLAPNSVPGLQSAISDWATRCEDALDDINARISAVRAEAEQRTRREANIEAVVNKAMKLEPHVGAEAAGATSARGVDLAGGNGSGAVTGGGRAVGNM